MVPPISVSGNSGTSTSYSNAISAGALVYSGYPGIYVLGFGDYSSPHVFQSDVDGGMIQLTVGTGESETFGATAGAFASGTFDITAIVIPQTWTPFTNATGTGFSQMTLDLSPWAASGALGFFASVADARGGTNFITGNQGSGQDGVASLNVSGNGLTSVLLSREPTEGNGGTGLAINPTTGADIIGMAVIIPFFTGGGGGGGGALCFVQGTPIAQPNGASKAVETFAVGDPVCTHDGRAVIVTDIYHTAVDTGAHPLDAPVRVPAGTLGATVNVDLSPRHGIVVPAPGTARGWKLVPAANAPGVGRAPGYANAAVQYWHLRLSEGAETLVAGGVPCESWRVAGTWDEQRAWAALYKH